MNNNITFPIPKKVEPYICEVSLGELKLLHYLSPICNNNPQLPNYMKNFTYFVNNLKVEGYFTNADLETFFKYKISISELKLLLKKYELSTSGKKEILISRILSNIDHSILFTEYDTTDYMVLSEKGKKTISEYPYEFLKNSELNYIANEYCKNMNPDIIKQYPEFFEFKIKALKPYSKYEVAIKLFTLTDITGFPEGILLKIERDLKSEIFEKLYGVTVPNGTFYQVKRYFKSIYDLKSYAERNSNRISYEYTIQTTNDERVCDFCKSMDGKKIIISDVVVGKNYPPFDNCKCDFCRCSARAKINIKS